MPICDTCNDEGEVEFCPSHPGRICPCRLVYPCPDCTAYPKDADDDLLDD